MNMDDIVRSIRRLKGVVTLAGILLTVVGVVMILLGIRGVTEVSVEGAEIKAVAKSVYVGIPVTLLGVVMAIVPQLVKHKVVEQTTTVTQSAALMSLETKRQEVICDQIESEGDCDLPDNNEQQDLMS